jgi:hypothetical protein
MNEGNTASRPAGNELSADQLDKVTGAGLTHIIIPLPPPPPGPPPHLRFGP